MGYDLCPAGGHTGDTTLGAAGVAWNMEAIIASKDKESAIYMYFLIPYSLRACAVWNRMVGLEWLWRVWYICVVSGDMLGVLALCMCLVYLMNC